jgi:integrase
MTRWRTTKTKYPGVYRRHRKDCNRQSGCDCPYEATAWNAHEGKLLRKTCPNLTAARRWRQDTSAAVRAGLLRSSSTATVREAGDELLAGMESGAIFTRSGRPYKPATIRGYREALVLRVYPALGTCRLSGVHRHDVQELADGWTAAGLSASTVQNSLDPLRVICRRAIRRDELVIDPTEHLELRRPHGQRDRIATPDEAERLLGALPDGDRALWATGLYAGLRRGELRALRWANVDLAGGRIMVESGWDAVEGEQEAKSDAGRRKVPILARLRPELVAHKLRTGRDSDDLVFGRTTADPFVPSTVRTRALKAWKATDLKPISLHECRHTFASLMIAAGALPKTIMEVMGHATIQMTFDQYGHLFPGGLDEAASAADAYLDRMSVRKSVRK